ncbi:hypothetical protein ES703_48522 [subsurface metagenome]
MLAFGIRATKIIQRNKPNINEMADFLAMQENSIPMLYITEVKTNETKYISPICSQSVPVKLTMGNNKRISRPDIKAIVTGISNVINPAITLPSST